MNKKYTINNIEVTAEQIKDIIKNNPELLEEKKVSGRYFFPKEGRAYWYIDETGHVECDEMNADKLDLERIEQGVFETKEEAELTRDKQKATVACWKWAEENAPFEPNWKNDSQEKFYAVFCTVFGRGEDGFFCRYTYTSQCQFTLPHFKTEKACENFIKANKANLELLFTK